MPSILTIPEIIEVSKVSVGLSFNYTSTKAYFGGTVIKPIPPVQVAIIASALEWGYEGGQAEQPLRNEGNYLWWMLSKFGLQAQSAVIGGGGGSVVPTPANNTLPNQLDWKVSDTASGIAPLADQEGAVTLDGTGGMPDLRGFNIDFARGGVWQNTTPLGDGSTYYYWNKVTGLFQLLGGLPAQGAAQLGELMRISPDLLSTGTTTNNINEPVTIFLDADGTYTLPNGYFIWKIRIKPTSADTVKIGTTLGGDDVMFDKLLTANVYGSNGTTVDVDADGANQIIYFTGFTTAAEIDLYILPL